MTETEGNTDRGRRNHAGILSFAYSRRFFLLFVLVVLLGLGVRAALKPAGFGELGHFRTAAPEEEAQRTPKLQGKMACAECHDREFEAHEKDIHYSVECEVCHGPGDEHVKARTEGLPQDQGRMFRELAQANCLACHRRLQARPKLFPTIDVTEHFALVGVADHATRCQDCHSPHEPLFLESKVSTARLHPLIHQCADCHVEPAVRTKPLPENHVVVFQCKDCHADVVRDFQAKAHSDLDCGTCHLFHQDSEFSGRIFKNGNPRFCLMCHQEKPFRAEGRFPLVASLEAHLDDVAMDDADRRKRCVDCHGEEKIHFMGRHVDSGAAPEGEMP
jgi:nitrate reductase cytochrome c-type subunit